MIEAMHGADAQLDTLIERRGRGNAEREREVMYAASVRRFNERRRREIQAEWFTFFSRMAESMRGRAEEYERRAEALCEDRAEAP